MKNQAERIEKLFMEYIEPKMFEVEMDMKRIEALLERARNLITKLL